MPLIQTSSDGLGWDGNHGFEDTYTHTVAVNFKFLDITFMDALLLIVSILLCVCACCIADSASSEH